MQKRLVLPGERFVCHLEEDWENLFRQLGVTCQEVGTDPGGKRRVEIVFPLGTDVLEAETALGSSRYLFSLNGGEYFFTLRKPTPSRPVRTLQFTTPTVFSLWFREELPMPFGR